MDAVDLNLLSALDVLLAEGSEIGAARRLGLSSSAMSRTLERLRRATGDPLLVRAGRGFGTNAPCCGVARPSPANLDLAKLDLTFTIRAGEWFMEMLSNTVVQEIIKAAPHVRLRFAPKRDSDPDLLRIGSVDLEIGKRGTSAPEIRTHLLFRDKYVGLARSGHPLFASGKVTPKLYAACGHVVASQLGEFSSSIDAALKALQLSRTVQVVVPGFPDAMRIAAGSDLIALIPHASLGNTFVGDRAATMGIQQFELPVHTPIICLLSILNEGIAPVERTDQPAPWRAVCWI